jgi:hypothetical protein
MWGYTGAENHMRLQEGALYAAHYNELPRTLFAVDSILAHLKGVRVLHRMKEPKRMEIGPRMPTCDEWGIWPDGQTGKTRNPLPPASLVPDAEGASLP